MYSKNCVEEKQIPGRSSLFLHWLLTDQFRQAISYLNLCFEIKQERRDLIKLTDAELRDIGLHPADVAAERRRSFFDIPTDRVNFYSEPKDDE